MTASIESVTAPTELTAIIKERNLIAEVALTVEAFAIVTVDAAMLKEKELAEMTQETSPMTNVIHLDIVVANEET